MSEFNPEAGGLAVMWALAAFMVYAAVHITWNMITQYYRGWIEALWVWGATAATVLLIFGIFLIGGSI